VVARNYYLELWEKLEEILSHKASSDAVATRERL